MAAKRKKGSPHRPGHRTGAKNKYGQPTTMLAVRIPGDLHDALKTTAARQGKPKSDVVVDVLTAALDVPEPVEHLGADSYERFTDEDLGIIPSAFE